MNIGSDYSVYSEIPTTFREGISYRVEILLGLFDAELFKTFETLLLVFLS